MTHDDVLLSAREHVIADIIGANLSKAATAATLRKIADEIDPSPINIPTTTLSTFPHPTAGGSTA
jgi:hypothetical protein